MNKKIIITSFVAGIIVAAFSYHAYTVYNLKGQVETQGQTIVAQSQTIAAHQQSLSEVVTYINQQIQNNQVKK